MDEIGRLAEAVLHLSRALVVALDRLDASQMKMIDEDPGIETALREVESAGLIAKGIPRREE